MNLIVRHMDFAGRRLTIAVEGAITAKDQYPLVQYLLYCLEQNFDAIDLCYKNILPVALCRTLKDVEEKRNASITHSRKSVKLGDAQASGSVRFTYKKTPTAKRRAQQTQYTLWLQDFDNAIDYVSQFIQIVGYAAPLDPSVVSRSRVCLTELTMNSIDHADFGSNDPTIEMTVTVDNRLIVARYRDNAKAFNSARANEVDIGEQIRRKNKRGLGLHMISKIANELEYERKNNWNLTTYALVRKKTSHHRIWRANMKDFSVEVKPMDSIDAVILKTTGSINSNTAPTLDSHLDTLISQQKYNVIVDLSDTDFISSSGIGVFLGTVTNLRDKGGDLILMNIPKLIDDIFEILNIRNYFRIIKNLDELAAAPKS